MNQRSYIVLKNIKTVFVLLYEPKGVVVNENTNGIVTVNGHSYEDPARLQITQTLPYWYQIISQSLSPAVTSMEKASLVFLIC